MSPRHGGDTPHPGHGGDTPHPGHGGDTPHPGCEQLEAELLDLRAPDAVSAPLAAHLSACADCRALADAHFGLAARMAAVPLAPAPAAWDAIAARIAAPAPGLLDRLVDWLRGLGAPALALAGAAAIALLAVSFREPGLTYRAGGAFTADGRALAATGTLSPGRAELKLDPGGWAEVALGAGSTVRVEGPGSFHLASRTRFELAQGAATLELAPQPAGFVAAVPGGEVRVIGTRFVLRADATGTRVEVERGVVEAAPPTGAPRRLTAGEGARLLVTGGFEAAEVAPSVAPAAESPAPASVRPSVALSAPPSASPASPPSFTPVRPGRRTEGGY